MGGTILYSTHAHNNHTLTMKKFRSLLLIIIFDIVYIVRISSPNLTRDPSGKKSVRFNFTTLIIPSTVHGGGFFFFYVPAISMAAITKYVLMV